MTGGLSAAPLRLGRRDGANRPACVNVQIDTALRSRRPGGGEPPVPPSGGHLGPRALSGAVSRAVPEVDADARAGGVRAVARARGDVWSSTGSIPERNGAVQPKWEQKRFGTWMFSPYAKSLLIKVVPEGVE